MSLGKCPECEGPLAENAFKCQNCGYETWHSRLQRTVFSLPWIAGTLMLLFFIGCTMQAKH